MPLYAPASALLPSASNAEPATITLAGEHVALLPERALFWSRKSTLLVADPHFGKAATFRAHGIPVPEATTGATLARLEGAIAATRAERIVFLGDFMHHRSGVTAAPLAALAGFRERHPTLAMALVRGNHDAHAGDPPEALDIECTDVLHDGPFTFVHEPTGHAGRYAIGGHVHPACVLGTGRSRIRLPCFLFGASVGILPAFGEFTGTFPVTPGPRDRIFVVAEDRVLPVPARVG